MRKTTLILLSIAAAAACASWAAWNHLRPETGRLADGGGEYQWWSRNVFKTWVEFIIESHRKTGRLPTRLSEFPDQVQKWVQSGALNIPHPYGSPLMNGNDRRHFLLLPVVGHDAQGTRVRALMLVLRLVEPDAACQDKPFRVHIVRERSTHGASGLPEPPGSSPKKGEGGQATWIEVETPTGSFVCANDWGTFQDHPLLEGMSTQRRSLDWFEVLAIYNKLMDEAEKE